MKKLSKIPFVITIFFCVSISSCIQKQNKNNNLKAETNETQVSCLFISSYKNFSEWLTYSNLFYKVEIIEKFSTDTIHDYYLKRENNVLYLVPLDFSYSNEALYYIPLLNFEDQKDIVYYQRENGNYPESLYKIIVKTIDIDTINTEIIYTIEHRLVSTIDQFVDLDNIKSPYKYRYFKISNKNGIISYWNEEDKNSLGYWPY